MKNLLVKLAIAVAAVFAPIKATIITVFCLCIADAILGVMAAKKRKEPITSAALRRTVSKIFIFEAVVMLGFLSEKFLLIDAFPICKLAASAIAVVELKSLLENCDEVMERNLFQDIISLLGSKNDSSDKKKE